MSEEKRYGADEPTKSFILPYSKTKGDEAIELYNKGKFTMEPWQGALLCSIMGRDEEDLWVHQKFGYSIPRRNGKTELVIARCLWGLANGEKILYTAHETATTHEIFERLEDLCITAKIPIRKPFRAFGREHIYTEDKTGRIEFKTRTTSGGMGTGFDLLILDECQMYTDTQASALKYVVTASQNPQTIMLGTPPTPTSAGTVFPNYRTKCLAGQAKYSGWAEWSVDYQATLDDIDALYQTNPSLGYHLTLRAIESEDDGESEIDLAIQRFGYWFKYSLKSVISEPDWKNCEVKELPKLTGSLFVGIKFSKLLNNISLGIAKHTEDGKIFIEVIDCRTVRSGYDWIIDFIKRAPVKEIVIDGDNGKGTLNDRICELIDDGDIDISYPTIPKTQDIIKANSLFEQGLLNKTMIHMEQPSLSQVVTNTEKRAIGTNGGFGYRSQNDQMDISLLDCVMLAHWICHDEPKEEDMFFDY